MSKVFRKKINFTSGIISPLLYCRDDNDRYKNGCRVLNNMHVKTQGPVTRRSGFRFIYDLSSLDADPAVSPRLVPFIFSADDSYCLCFFKHKTTSTTRVVFGSGTGLVEDPDSPGDPYVFAFTGTLDVTDFHWAQSGDVLFITQEDRMPIEFRRVAEGEWAANEVSVTVPPFVTNKTAITLTASALTGTITLTASAALFTSAYVGHKIKLNGGQATITVVTSNVLVTATVTTDLTATTATTEWATTEWGPFFGYPRFVGFYEQRLFYAATPARPQTIWFSKSGDYYDFGVSSPIVASDAATFTLDSGTQNRIQWVQSSRQIVLGTLGDEWAISGSGYEPLSFSSVRASKHTNHGGEDLVPLMIGPVIIFLELMGRTVNQLVYDFNSDSYNTVDLSVLAPDLTDNYGIIDWDYQQTPNGIVWAVREDGTLLGLTFKREHNVTGWHTHDTQGEFLSVACLPGDRETDVWTVVKRTVEDVDLFYLEKKAPEFLSDDILDSYFLDSHLVYSGTAATTITGLEHLEGMLVDVLGDGFVFPNLTVTDGEVSLSVAVEKAVVGLRYVSEVVPQMPEFDLKDGATMGRVRRSDHVAVVVHRSLGITIGKYDSERGEIATTEIPSRLPQDDVSVAGPLLTGTYRFPIGGGSDRSSELFIRQTLPLPLTVVGIIDELEVR